MATGYGLQLVGRLDGKTPSINAYSVPASDSTALYIGDVVKLPDTTGAMNGDSTLINITQAVAGDATKLGVVVGFEPDPAHIGSANYRAASTLRTVLVCDDPEAIYSVQEDADGGAVSAANVGAMVNANIIVAAGSTVTGFSGTMLDSNTATASAADLKIIGVVQEPGNYAAKSGGAKLLVRILNAESSLVAADSQL